CAYKMFQWTNQKHREHVEGSASTPLKLLAAAGILVAIAFTILLLAPGSPAQLTMPSFIAMGAWLAIGAIFYTTQYRHNQTIPNTDVDTAVLGKPRPHWAQTH
ncbi:MAG: APC family permease, partial [Nesterenkonia sp.]